MKSFFRRLHMKAYKHRFAIAIGVLSLLTLAMAVVTMLNEKLIPEATATLAGSFFGAFIAVVGAAWYAHSERVNSDRETALAIRLLVDTLEDDVADAIDMHLRESLDPNLKSAIEAKISSALLTIETASDDLRELRQHIGSFGAVNIVGILELGRALASLRSSLQDFSQWRFGKFGAIGDPVEDLKIELLRFRTTLGWVQSI